MASLEIGSGMYINAALLEESAKYLKSYTINNI